MNKQGFTLIELMVVVLIIGILTAIALPQFETAVEKSRMSEAMINAKAIVDASQRYFQANPNETTITKRNQIADVDLRGGQWNEDGTVYTTELFTYTLGGADGQVTVARVDEDGTLYTLWQKPDLDGTGGTLKGCAPGSTDPETAEQMCKFFTGI